MALCSTCLQNFPREVDSEWQIDNHSNRYIQRPFALGDVLREGAEAACFMCTHVYEASKNARLPWVRATCELEPSTDQQPWYRVSIKFAHEGDNPDVTEYMGPKFVVQPDNHAADLCGTAATETTFTGSEEHMGLARHWLSTCLDSHSECDKNQSPSQYPTRLLRIAGCDVRLIETAAYDLSEPYATLSHCWGVKHFECLTVENKDAFEKGKPRSSLPPTFRDALHVAEQLDIHLVWIDSYCIIQSSQSADAAFTKDKMAEIARMKDVYANAILNIGAAHGSGPQAGCFVRREQLQTERRRFNWRPKDTDSDETCCIREAYNSRHLSALYSQQGLFKRGWVMQERLLAPRMLYFTDKQLYWECGTGLASEVYPEGMPEHGPKSDPTNAWPLFTVEQMAKDSWETWNRVVRSYSSLSLTWPAQDKLPAVGAIAAVMAEKNNDAYVAGLFQGDFLRALCWRTLIESDWGVQRLGDASAPSWSWASVGCHVGYKDITAADKPMAAVDDFRIQLKDPANPYGAVASGTVTLRARLLPAKLAPDTREGEFKRMKLITRVAGIADEERFGWAFSSLEEFDELTQGPVYFLPMYWALDYLPRINGIASEPMELCDALAVGAAEREALYKNHRIHGMLLVRQHDFCFKRLHMLFWTPAEILGPWGEKKEELITLV